MLRSTIFLVFLLLSLFVASSFSTVFSTGDPYSWIEEIKQKNLLALNEEKTGFVDASESIRNVLTHFSDKIAETLPAEVVESIKANVSSDKFFGFIPLYIDNLQINESYSWSAPCHNKNEVSVTLETNANGTTEAVLKFRTRDRVGPLGCEDMYLLATVGGAKIISFLLPTEHTESWPLPSNGTAGQIEAETWDIYNKGFRLFRFLGGKEKLIADITTTVELFVPALLNGGIPLKNQELNHKFLADYSLINMEKRENTTVIELDESQINSGDFLGVIRLDGLDPMLAWGMGSHTGHTTVALWVDGQLYICESTTSSKYWPTNGIQMNPYRDWLKLARKADYNVVHLPMSAEYRAKFNETAAYEWFKTVEGLPYGYNNMLLTWIDLPEDNYPCLPDGNFSEYCLQAKHVEVLAGIVDKIDNDVADLMFNLALNKRLSLALNLTDDGTVLRFPEVIYKGEMNENKAYNFSDLMNIPEQDEWVYPTGKQMVCDVLVCSMWKNAGLFEDLAEEVQCTEFTNWDAYSLLWFNASYVRPQECVDADPDSQFCQLMGNYRMTLPGYNSKLPYANMAENCPSKNPYYEKPAHC